MKGINNTLFEELKESPLFQRHDLNRRIIDFLDIPSFPKEEMVVPRAGLEPATTRSSASPSTMRVVESSALPI